MSAIFDDPLSAVRDAARARFAAFGQCGTAPPIARNLPPPGQPGPGTLSKAHYTENFDKGKRAENGAQSTYDGTIAALLLDRDIVSPILPPQMRLATPAGARSQHPVICMLGRQNEPRQLVGGEPQEIPNAQPYYELILLIPYVVHVSGNRWHSYSARMYLDYEPAIIIGNGRFAYSKELGGFEQFGDTSEVTSYGNTVFEIDIADNGNWLGETPALVQWPSFADLQEVMTMPIVGHNSLLGCVRSYFEWDYSEALISQTQSALRFNQEFRAGMQPWLDLDLLAGAADATFSVRKVRWRLSTAVLGPF